MERDNPSVWPLGSWLQHEDTPEDKAALASLPLSLSYPRGGQHALRLAGWDERSTWGFDPPDEAYFAQLWPNGSTSDSPEIWILGRGKVDGRELILTTTHLLALEIAAATGLPLPLVCAAIAGEHP